MGNWDWKLERGKGNVVEVIRGKGVNFHKDEIR